MPQPGVRWHFATFEESNPCFLHSERLPYPTFVTETCPFPFSSRKENVLLSLLVFASYEVDREAVEVPEVLLLRGHNISIVIELAGTGKKNQGPSFHIFLKKEHWLFPMGLPLMDTMQNSTN